MANIRYTRTGAHRRHQLTQLTRDTSRRTNDFPDRLFDPEVGKPVRVMRTGVIANVSSKTGWGDFVLEGIEGFFSGSQLEEVSE